LAGTAGGTVLSVRINQASDDERRNDPVGSDELLEYFHDGSKPRTEWRVGAEFEKFAVERSTGRHLTYGEAGGIREILEALVERFAWEPHFEGEHLTTLSRGGAMISLEPGGQVEFSTPPVETIAEIDASLQAHRSELRAVTDPERIAWIATGVSPFQSADEIPLGVRRRHKLMAEYLPGRCPKALEMMKATASTQVTFDYADEADAMRKFRVALKLSPLVNAIWANSSHYAGKPTGFASYRSQVWLGMDPDRSGLLQELLADGLSFERWVRYLLDVPMLFVCEEDEYRPADGLTFREFMASGHDGYFPTMADWELHLTTVFPEVRLKHFLEVRGADANPPALAVAVAALWKGLLYDSEALAGAEELSEKIAPRDLPHLFSEIGRTGLATRFGADTVLAFNGRIVQLAEAGLTRQGEPGDTRYLESVREILLRGSSPGSELLHRKSATFAEQIAAFEY
jgi:glutamate--cysteine ligase